ncbi:MAG: arginine--tRNA ligase [Proteobacteria bacterium]|nr:arginine--tRNA ligase [Pseudomonadota bacterium]NBX86881.1 arginine--tRNA ligase [Pseudomonadota bacterium]
MAMAKQAMAADGADVQQGVLGQVREAIRGQVRGLFGDKVEEKLVQAVGVELPRDEGFGDVSTNAAMVLAKPLAANPRVIGQQVMDGLLRDHANLFEKIELAGAGFVNMTLRLRELLRLALAVPLWGVAFGRLAVAARQKYLVEYVSINPTGPIHVGHGRNAVFGDVIARMLERVGHTVWREYLVNDAGGQIRVLVNSLHIRYRQLFGEEVMLPEGAYPGEYLIEIAKQLRARDGDKWLAVRDEAALFEGLRAFAVESCMALIKADVERMGITFDRYFSEFAMHQGSAMAEAVAALRAKDLVFEGTLPPPKGKEVANYVPVELTLFRATAFGLGEDQAVYNRAGQPTYFGQDIAYHMDKLQRGFDKLVTVVGIDQAGAFKPLAKAIEALCGRADAYHPVPYEMVKVLRNGEPVKLSKRAGNIMLLSEVLDEVGVDAFRFMMLTVKPTTALTFDLAKAVEKSMENPVFYVQYAHARLCAVFRQAGDLGIVQPADVVDEAALEAALAALEGQELSAAARAVVRQVMVYPAVLEQAAASLEPHRLANFASALAAAVHHWYGAEKWLDTADAKATAVRLQVARAAQVILADVLKVCGVLAPESM